MRLVVALAFAVAAIGGACTLLDDAPPDDACRDDSDCFRAQGEFCNPSKKRCEMKVLAVGPCGVIRQALRGSEAEFKAQPQLPVRIFPCTSDCEKVS